MESKLEWDDMIYDIIKNKYRKYFTCSSVVDFVEARLKQCSIRTILGGKKTASKKRLKERDLITSRVRKVLIQLHREGRIQKYSKRTWEKL